MGALLGLSFGLGLLLLLRRGPAGPSRLRALAVARRQRRTELLRRAGIDGVTPAQLLLLQAVAVCSPRPPLSR